MSTIVSYPSEDEALFVRRLLIAGGSVVSWPFLQDGRWMMIISAEENQ